MKRDLHMFNPVSAILAVLAVTISLNSCERIDVPARGQGTGRFISFTAVEDSVWPDVTKGAISGVGDLLGDGFSVWASWTKDPLDRVVYGEEYYLNGVNGAVFGESGTIVTAADTDGDGEFVQVKDEWTYSPQQEWYRGYYSFAAVIPASAFKNNGGVTGAHYPHSAASVTLAYSDDKVTGVTYNNRLTLDFPDDLFVLGGHSVIGTRLPLQSQPDLMYAFAEVDNTANEAENVKLQFTHTCAKLSILLSVNDPTKTMSVQKITIYGLLNAIPTPLEFTHTRTAGQTEDDSNFSAMLAAAADDPEEYRSTLDNPFAVFTRPEGEGDDAFRWDIKGSDPENPVAVRLVEDLLVFPGHLSASNQLKIKIDYKNGDDLLTTFVKISQGEWKPGQSYAYSFQADYASDSI
jgi:hypothetical protein